MRELTAGSRPEPGSFVAPEIADLDPSRDAADERSRARLRELLTAHGVLCIRFAAPLDDAAARRVAAMIGPIKDPIGRTRDGGEIRYAEDRQVIDSGFVLSEEMRAALGDLSLGGDGKRPGLFEAFHTDDSYVERPAIATVLHARALPPSGGGDTCFIDMRAAYRSLDRARQQSIVGLRAVHAYDNRDAFPPRPSARGPLEVLRDVAHPIVRAHPLSGEPALFFDLDRATHVDGVPVDEGRRLLQALQDHAERHAPRYAHRWRPHDVLIWDNASVQHKASGDFALGEPRRFWRYMIAGPEPVGLDPSSHPA